MQGQKDRKRMESTAKLDMHYYLDRREELRETRS